MIKKLRISRTNVKYVLLFGEEAWKVTRMCEKSTNFCKEMPKNNVQYIWQNRITNEETIKVD